MSVRHKFLCVGPVRWHFSSLDTPVPAILMSSSAFAFLAGKNSGRGGFSAAARKAPMTPAEDLLVVVDASQVVKVLLPFNTARAPAIRQFAQAYLVDDNNRRVLIFRKEMEGGPAWTNIALEATAQEPRLTMPPYELCVLVDAKMSMYVPGRGARHLQVDRRRGPRTSSCRTSSAWSSCPGHQ